MWCKKYDKDYETEDFNQIKEVPDEEYQELQRQALHAILCNGKCPSCWEDFSGAPRMCKSKSVVPIKIVCPRCQFPFKVTPRLRIADWIEDD